MITPGTEFAMSDDLLRELSHLAESVGATVHVVGGYVRDRLLRREPVDLDLLVEGSPAGFLEALSRRARFQPIVFSRHEPVTHRIALDDWLIDVSCCQPDRLVEELQRRDFTLNALSAALYTPDPSASDFSSRLDHPFDPLGGLADLNARRIRHISLSGLDEDPLRLLRAVRLTVTLEGFSLDETTREAIPARAGSLAGVAVERILGEMEVILASPHAGAGVRMMRELGLLFPVFPEMAALDGLKQNRWHRYDVLEHSIQTVGEADLLQQGHDGIGVHRPIGIEDAEVLKWAALLHDTGKATTSSTGTDGGIHFYGHEAVSATIAEEVLTRLRVGNRKVQRVVALVENHLRLTLLATGAPVSDKTLRRVVHRMKYETPLLCLLALADRRAGGGPDFEQRMHHLEQIATRVIDIFTCDGEHVISPVPLLSGNEVMELLGLEPGPRVGSVMRWLTRLQVEEKLTRQEQAINLLKSLPESRLRTLDDEP